MKNPANRCEVTTDADNITGVTFNKSGIWTTFFFTPTEAAELGKALATVLQPGDVYEIPFDEERTAIRALTHE